MPLFWDEVKPGLKMKDFTIQNAPARLKDIGDIFVVYWVKASIWLKQLPKPKRLLDNLLQGQLGFSKHNRCESRNIPSKQPLTPKRIIMENREENLHSIQEHNPGSRDENQQQAEKPQADSQATSGTDHRDEDAADPQKAENETSKGFDSDH